MSETLPLAHVKAKLSEMVDRVEHTHDRITLTRNGRPAAVLISPDELASLEETLDLLADPDAMVEIRGAQAAVATGDVVTRDELRGKYFAQRAKALVATSFRWLRLPPAHSKSRRPRSPSPSSSSCSLRSSTSRAASVSRCAHLPRLAGDDPTRPVRRRHPPARRNRICLITGSEDGAETRPSSRSDAQHR